MMQERKKDLFLDHGCQNGPWIKEAHKGELERSCYVANCTTIMIPITQKSLSCKLWDIKKK